MTIQQEIKQALYLVSSIETIVYNALNKYADYTRRISENIIQLIYIIESENEGAVLIGVIKDNITSNINKNIRWSTEIILDGKRVHRCNFHLMKNKYLDLMIVCDRYEYNFSLHIFYNVYELN